MQNSLHASLYTIYVEIKGEDRFLLLHGYTGAMDLVGRNVASFLREGSNIGRGPASTNYGLSGDAIAVLKNRGYLTDMTPDEERLYVSGLAGFFHRAAERVSSFFFLVVYDCNLTCPYCYEGSISGFGDRWSKQVMSKELTDRAFEAMLKINPSRDLHDKNITLFGGEPLLADNHDIVSYIVGKGAREGYVFTAITNAYDLDHYVNILKPGLLQCLQISLDGVRDEHNRMRVHRDGENTFDHIMKNIEIALRRGTRVNVRVNIHNGTNSGSIAPLFNEFVERGWVRSRLFNAYTARVHYPGNIKYDLPVICASDLQKADRFAADSPDCEAAEETIIRRTAYLSDLKSRLKRLFDGETWALFRGDYCGATTGMYVFDPNGDIYPCLEAVGMPEHRVGVYNENFELREKELSKWRERKFEDENCCACKYFLFCGGGCPASSVLRDGATRRERCDDFPVVFRRLVAETYKEFSGNKNVPADRVIPSGKNTNFHNKERREA